MKVSSVGVELELQLRPTPQQQQHRILAVSVTYTTAHSNAGSLTHWARPGVEPSSLWILVRFFTCWDTAGTPSFFFFFKYNFSPHKTCTLKTHPKSDWYHLSSTPFLFLLNLQDIRNLKANAWLSGSLLRTPRRERTKKLVPSLPSQVGVEVDLKALMHW